MQNNVVSEETSFLQRRFKKRSRKLRDLVQVLKETACDLVRVILATANMLKNHLPLIAGATAFALSLPSHEVAKRESQGSAVSPL